MAIAADGAALAGDPVHLKITVTAPPSDAPVTVVVRGAGRELGRFDLGAGEHAVVADQAALAAGRPTLVATVETAEGTVEARAETAVRVIPGWLWVLPPLIAIGLALITKDVLVSLFLGIFGGALIRYDWNPLTAFARTIDHFVISSLTDPSKAKIIVFTTLLGGMVALIGRAAAPAASSPASRPSPPPPAAASSPPGCWASSSSSTTTPTP